jgi:flavin-binding protein dodecin
MAEKVFKKVRLVGCSTEGFEKAIETAAAKAAETVHGASWFEVVELRGALRNGKVSEYQATIDLGFKVD